MSEVIGSLSRLLIWIEDPSQSLDLWQLGHLVWRDPQQRSLRINFSHFNIYKREITEEHKIANILKNTQGKLCNQTQTKVK
jgi:hypothetical protein